MIFDNGSLLSIGGIPTATAGRADLAAIASAAGVPRTCSVRKLTAFAKAFATALYADALTTIVAKIEPSGPVSYDTDLTPIENRYEFRRWLAAKEGHADGPDDKRRERHS